MAEIVLTSAVTALFEKLLSVDLMKLTHSEGIESQLQNLKTKWRYFEAVLADASERLITEESVKVWLQDLHSLAYDLEDVLDDMATEIMRRKLNDDSRGRTSTGLRPMVFWSLLGFRQGCYGGSRWSVAGKTQISKKKHRKTDQNVDFYKFKA
ncbi:putative disease resistance RPP13-like protein 1 isoform X2 [Rutidosis leptorrhynchoides]|uniref:putative disease resistance RPP13-like protein 1 isoform X2 n=1 Tax=Rutidosis leptorrhynchoides TaxID=125765 RepID=UPI003A99E081